MQSFLRKLKLERVLYAYLLSGISSSGDDGHTTDFENYNDDISHWLSYHYRSHLHFIVAAASGNNLSLNGFLASRFVEVRFLISENALSIYGWFHGSYVSAWVRTSVVYIELELVQCPSLDTDNAVLPDHIHRNTILHGRWI